MSVMIATVVDCVQSWQTLDVHSFQATMLTINSNEYSSRIYMIFAVRCYASAARVIFGVCLCVTFVHSVKTNKHIFNICSQSGSQAILVYLYQTAWQFSDGNPPNGGVKCRCGKQKSWFWAYVWLDYLLLTLQQARCCQRGRRWTTATIPQVECDTSLVISGGVDCGRRWQNFYDKKPRRYAKDNRTAFNCTQ